jgi:hypothetical protein
LFSSKQNFHDPDSSVLIGIKHDSVFRFPQASQAVGLHFYTQKTKSTQKGAHVFAGGEDGNRTRVQKVFVKKSTYIARFLV